MSDQLFRKPRDGGAQIPSDALPTKLLMLMENLPFLQPLDAKKIQKGSKRTLQVSTSCMA